MENELESVSLGKKWFPARKKMNWEEHFCMMKRWYYRLRDTDDFFSLKVSYKEDFLLLFLLFATIFLNG